MELHLPYSGLSRRPDKNLNRRIQPLARFEAGLHRSILKNALASGIELGFGTQVLHVVYHGRMQRPDRGRDVIPWVWQRKDDALACKAPD